MIPSSKSSPCLSVPITSPLRGHLGHFDTKLDEEYRSLMLKQNASPRQNTTRRASYIPKNRAEFEELVQKEFSSSKLDLTNLSGTLLLPPVRFDALGAVTKDRQVLKRHRSNLDSPARSPAPPSPNSPRVKFNLFASKSTKSGIELQSAIELPTQEARFSTTMKKAKQLLGIGGKRRKVVHPPSLPGLNKSRSLGNLREIKISYPLGSRDINQCSLSPAQKSPNALNALSVNSVMDCKESWKRPRKLGSVTTDISRSTSQPALKKAFNEDVFGRIQSVKRKPAPSPLEPVVTIPLVESIKNARSHFSQESSNSRNTFGCVEDVKVAEPASPLNEGAILDHLTSQSYSYTSEDNFLGLDDLDEEPVDVRLLGVSSIKNWQHVIFGTPGLPHQDDDDDPDNDDDVSSSIYGDTPPTPRRSYDISQALDPEILALIDQGSPTLNSAHYMIRVSSPDILVRPMENWTEQENEFEPRVGHLDGDGDASGYEWFENEETASLRESIQSFLGLYYNQSIEDEETHAGVAL